LSLISQNAFDKLSPNIQSKLKPTKVTVSAISRNMPTVHITGYIDLRVSLHGNEQTIRFSVMKEPIADYLLGISDAQKFGIIIFTENGTYSFPGKPEVYPFLEVLLIKNCNLVNFMVHVPVPQSVSNSVSVFPAGSIVTVAPVPDPKDHGSNRKQADFCGDGTIYRELTGMSNPVLVAKNTACGDFTSAQSSDPSTGAGFDSNAVSTATATATARPLDLDLLTGGQQDVSSQHSSSKTEILHQILNSHQAKVDTNKVGNLLNLESDLDFSNYLESVFKIDRQSTTTPNAEGASGHPVYLDVPAIDPVVHGGSQDGGERLVTSQHQVHAANEVGKAENDINEANDLQPPCNQDGGEDKSSNSQVYSLNQVGDVAVNVVGECSLQQPNQTDADVPTNNNISPLDLMSGSVDLMISTPGNEV
jgi:hypothetical protein